MPVTIFDVAKKAGVSKSTVSLVLNNSPKVKFETRNLVNEAIRELGYVPNLNARGLITRSTNNLGVIILVADADERRYDFDMETECYANDIIVGIPGGLTGTSYGLLQERFCTAYASGEAEERLPACVQNNAVDGVFIIGSSFDYHFLRRIREKGIPVVLIGHEIADFDYVVPDVRESVRLVVENLVKTGHRKLCYINCPPSYLSHEHRAEGFFSGLAENPVEKHWVIDAASNTGMGAYLAIKALWESGERPDAILGANDGIALGAMRYLYEQNIRVPGDISVVGYEDSVLSGYSVPPLSTVNISKEHMGAEACAILLNRIEKPKMRKVQVVVPPVYVSRGSVQERA